MTVRLSRLALRDIEEIRTFTVQHWGRAQWLRYFAVLSAALDQIATDPSCGRPCALIRSGMRSLSVQRHVIFFAAPSEPGARVAILRIIHERRNFAALSYHDEIEG